MTAITHARPRSRGRSSYVRFEILRNARDLAFVGFSLVWPLVLYVTVGSTNRHKAFDDTSFPLYFMTAMMAMGTMIAVVSTGARIAQERAWGWTRQLRITPLPAGTYFTAKVICGYLMALLTVAVLAVAGTVLGVRLSAGAWAQLIGMVAAGLVPFTILGIMLGHRLRSQVVAPVVGGCTTLFALLGGAYGFLIATSGPMFDVIRLLPSYWLVQAGKSALGGSSWPAEGWLVVAGWTAVLLPLAVLAYRRDTSRS
jgi:ABC-2 type transport system permease protein